MVRVLRIRLIAVVLWVLLGLSLSALYIQRPDLLDPEHLVGMLRGSGQPVLLGYLALNIVRAVTLIPSTVLIIVGTLLFPGRPVFVIVSSLSGVVASALLIYYFFEFLGLCELFGHRQAKRVRWLERQMNAKGFWLVVGWSAFPFVPTDVICYVAGTLRMHVVKFACGVGLGELPVVVFYVWATGALVCG